MKTKIAHQSQIIKILLFIVVVLLCTAGCIGISKSATTLGTNAGRFTIIRDNAVPLSASSGSEENPIHSYITEQEKQNAEYPLDKSTRNGLPVPFVPLDYTDAPWDATFPELEEEYAAASMSGYEMLNEEKCQAIFDGINYIRGLNGLNSLILDTSGNLYKFTYIRAVETMERYSHERPDGTTAVTSMSDLYVYGEILNGKKTIDRTLLSWVLSPEHYEVILLRDVQEMAVVGIEADYVETVGRQAVLFGNRECDY